MTTTPTTTTTTTTSSSSSNNNFLEWAGLAEPPVTTRLVVLVGDGVHEGSVEVERRPVLPEGVVVAGGVPAMEGEARLADADPGLV